MGLIPGPNRTTTPLKRVLRPVLVHRPPQGTLTNSLSRLRCRSQDSALSRSQRSAAEHRFQQQVGGKTKQTGTTGTAAPHLEQRYPDEYASDHRQVVLEPLLKLRDAAFHVDLRPLLGILGGDERRVRGDLFWG